MVYLMYHDLVKADDSNSGFQNTTAFQYKVDVDVFEETLRQLKGREEVTFTFDDGGVSFLTEVAPLLEKYGRRGIFFISTEYIGTSGFLTREQVEELERRGHTIGSHSHSHPDNIAVLKPTEIDTEWGQSCKILEAILGHSIEMASIPNGYASETVKAAAMKAGITELYTSEPTTRSKSANGQKLYGRYVVHRDMTAEDVVLLVTDRSRQRKVYCRWYILELAKRVLGTNYNRIKGKLIRK